LLTLTALPRSGFAHCQIPCGIYDDSARIEGMHEDATTIEKAIKNIDELAGKGDAQSANELTRWIMIKEDHASDIITTVAEYFLTQKVKPMAPGADVALRCATARALVFCQSRYQFQWSFDMVGSRYLNRISLPFRPADDCSLS